MALPKSVEDALAKMPDENYRKVAREAFESNPDILKGFMAQEDYSRNMNKVKETEVAQKKWYDDNVAKLSSVRTLTEQNEQLTTVKTQLESQLADLQSRAAGGDLTVGENQAVMNEIKGVKEMLGTVQTAIKGSVSVDQVEKLINERGQSYINFTHENLLDTLDIRERSAKDFGKALTKTEIQELWGYAAEKGISKLEDAYNAKFGQQIRDTEIKRIQEEADRKAEEKYKTIASVPPSPGVSLDSGAMNRRFNQDPGNSQHQFASLDEAVAAAATATREGK